MILEQIHVSSMGGGTNVQISSKMVKLGGGDLGLAIDAIKYPNKWSEWFN